MTIDAVSLDEYDPGLVEMLERLMTTTNIDATESQESGRHEDGVDLPAIELTLQSLLHCNLQEKRFVKIRGLLHNLAERIDSYTDEAVIGVRQSVIRKLLDNRKKSLKEHDRKYRITRRLRAQRLEALSLLEGESRRLICGVSSSSSPLLVANSEPSDRNSEEIEDGGAAVPIRQLFHPAVCYICKQRFVDVHHFYDQLCPTCAELNWTKRNFRADLTGMVFLLTGARVKIGFECCKRLLECNATVLATTRFPMDCARRFAELPDYDSFKSRLHIFGIDLRDLKSTIRLTDRIKAQYSRLDGIINNAAQTVRRPPVYYQHMMDIESNPSKFLSAESLAMVDNFDSVSDRAITERSADEVALSESFSDCVSASASLSQLALLKEDLTQNGYFPKHQFDINGQQLDLRPQNSWTLLCHEVSPVEIIEVFAVNALSPFILNSRLKPLLKATPGNKFVINVSAMEGKFYRFKGATHPHTNMAKAALNMLTRTSAQDFVEDNIFMNSVDTGWINDENPFEKCVENAQNNFSTPIDEMDAMARIVDPILDGVANGVLPFGKFLKDFYETEW